MLMQMAPQRTSYPTAATVTPKPTATLVAAGRILELQQSLTIGRDAACDLHLDGVRVGEQHAEIYPIGKLWWLRDLGSCDGTYLDDELIEAVPLSGRSEIRLGATGPTLQFNPASQS